ncbi:MAG: hypothetical protein M3Y87_27090 [Myxococcota bacterium]|nr:hypothetical protein [Myxococcota bacterium]
MNDTKNNPEKRLLQLTPTASWWFKIGSSTSPSIDVISLGGVLVQAQPTTFSFSKHREHWLIDASITDLASTLGTADLVVAKQFASQGTDVPTSGLEDDAATVADAAKWRFQTKAKGKLDDSPSGDWTEGAPPMGNGTLLYYELKGQVANDSPRVLFELTANKENFARITWLTKTPYTAQTAGYTLEQKSLPTSWTGYYYYSVATGL